MGEFPKGGFLMLRALADTHAVIWYIYIAVTSDSHQQTAVDRDCWKLPEAVLDEVVRFWEYLP